MSQEALLIIDVQTAILDLPELKRPAETHAALDCAVSRIRELLARARERGVPVIFVRHDGGRRHRLERGTPGWEIRADIAPLPGEPVIDKTACDSFYETTLASELRKRGIERLFVTGCMTQYCVDTTVRRAVSEGFDTVLVSDAHMTADTGGFPFEQIVAYHNTMLNGIGAGKCRVRILPGDRVLV